MIGKGGSSRVYKVLNHNNQMFAVKRVSLDRTDQETMSGYMNEISLLKRLEGSHRIIRLIDSEVKAGPDGSKGHLTLVMELGEIGVYTAVALHWILTTSYRYGETFARPVEATFERCLGRILLAAGLKFSLKVTAKVDRESTR